MSECTYRPEVAKRPAHDVVVGGGVAGVAAALAARRNGSSVLLMEKMCALGGLATAGLINFFVPLCNGHGVAIMKGMAEEFLRESIRYGYNTLPEPWRNGEAAEPTPLRYATFYSPNIFALQLVERLRQEGVDLLYDTTFEDVVCENGRCTRVMALCEEGHCLFPAGAVVDATGASLVFHQAGAPTELGRNYFTYHGYQLSLASCAQAVARQNIRYACQWRSGGNSSLYGEHHPEGMDYFHGDSSAHVTEYLTSNQCRLLEKLKPEPPASRELLTLPMMPQLRKVRRLQGEYTLTEADIYRHFDDSITALCDSERRDSLYEIPFRTMYNAKFPNLVAAGRNISAAGYMWDVTRVIPPAIVTGQAAGTAAALAVRHNVGMAELPVAALQRHLAEQNVMIHFDDAWVPAQRQTGEFAPAGLSQPE